MTDTDTTTTETPAATTETTDAKRIFIMVTMPAELHDAIVADAKREGVGKATYARQLLADKYGIKLEESVSRTHGEYVNDEEKKAAKEAATKSRADLLKKLKAEHKLAIAKAMQEAADAAVASLRAKSATDAATEEIKADGEPPADTTTTTTTEQA